MGMPHCRPVGQGEAPGLVKHDMDDSYVISIVRLVAATAAGGLIGIERSYHGRPAGFRTHTLVAVASSLLMLINVFPEQLLKDAQLEVIRVDPTRMAQGIMTGIGFLGAGVIVKEGLTVRGLTTAASIWTTAAIGIVIGMGLFFAAAIGVGIVVGTLSAFRWVEGRIQSDQYAKLAVTLPLDFDETLEDLAAWITSHSVSISTPSYSKDERGFVYEMTIETRDEADFQKLAKALGQREGMAFTLVRTGVSE